ncbi:hypothetical protein DUI87_08588 [Hirundo rustica rustica]|uniref:Uncharacterized protein n=1 Tax=Hirundo rustica rustica TaxID=333673 RepID=A0A3M0KJT6_HIRRU|nr:hypothetical protein DUI87_08588 [Hirundo rustica rustica]
MFFYVPWNSCVGNGIRVRCQGFVMSTVTSQGPTVTMAGVKERRALGCPLSGEHFPQEAASPLELLAALQHRVSERKMEKHWKHSSSLMHKGLLSVDWMQQMMEAAGGTGWWWDEAAWSYLVTGAGLAGTVRDAEPWQLPPSHCSPSCCSCFPREKAFLNLGQPLPTGLQELEAFSSTQKVLWWLETHVPSDPGSLAKEDEDWGNKTDKEQTQGILEEDITRPVSSKGREDRSQKQESQAMSKEDSGQEVFQGQEDENPAARGLEELEAFSSTQKVLWWLETHVPSDPGSLAKEDEDWRNKTDKEQTQGILEEDVTRQWRQLGFSNIYIQWKSIS